MGGLPGIVEAGPPVMAPDPELPPELELTQVSVQLVGEIQAVSQREMYISFKNGLITKGEVELMSFSFIF